MSTSHADASSAAQPDASAVRAVLGLPAFRRLWTALTLSSFGDWLGLLATTALATKLSDGDYAKANLAVAGVYLLRLTPAVIFGPIAGAVADRLDRRWTMVVCDALRFLLFLSIPFAHTLTWLFVATFLIECAAMFWIPAKEASVPNLVPRERLETANQLSLLTTYGSAPVAAAVFALLTVAGGPLSRHGVDVIDIAIYVDAATFLVSALTISRLTAIPGTRQAPEARPPVWRTIVEGWRFVGGTPMVRGLVLGMLGAFAAGGAVVGLARTHVADLGAGDPGYGVLFAAVFLGLAAGMGLGPRLAGGFSRRRLFGLGITAAGTCLAILALLPDMVLATLATFVLGFFSGVAWVTGYTLLGLEVADEVRGRTFAFVQSMVRIVLVATLAAVPLLAAAIGQHSAQVGETTVTYNGSAFVFFFAGLLAAGLGLTSLRAMDDRPGVAVLPDLWRSLRGSGKDADAERVTPSGFFLVFEGGDGAGKSTQVRRVQEWLTARGYDVVVTREPGATALGQRLRALLLDPSTTDLSDRAEALLYAADRAQHVDTLVRPALERDAVVVSDRYIDSSLAYQGAGRTLPVDEVARISHWATNGLVPDLTVLLDVPSTVGAERRGGEHDRLEAESEQFHDRVRQGFLDLAAARPERYLVLDAALPADEVHTRIRERLLPLLPPSAAEVKARRIRERQEAAEAAAEGRAREAARQERVARARAEIEARQAVELAALRERAERERRERLEQEARRREIEAEEARLAAEAQAHEARLAAEAEQTRRIAAEERREREVRERAERQAREAEERGRRIAAERERAQRRAAPAEPTQVLPAVEPSLADDLFELGADDASDRGEHR